MTTKEQSLYSNLLLALDALLVESNVSQAAERVGITQSGMSHALNRLRRIYNDPLLIRTSRGMELSPFAQDLVGPVKQAMDALERATSLREGFDPSTCSTTFVVGLEDAIQSVVAPDLVAHLGEHAPNVKLSCVRNSRPEDLKHGRVDMIIWNMPIDDYVHVQTLYTTEFVTIARRDHPLVKKKLTVERFASCRHAIADYSDPHGEGVEDEIDRQLAKLGLEREKPVKISSFIALKNVVQSSNLIATVPGALMQKYAPEVELATHRTPIPLEPVTIYLIWGTQGHRHPAHRWFRSVLSDLIIRHATPG